MNKPLRTSLEISWRLSDISPIKSNSDSLFLPNFIVVTIYNGRNWYIQVTGPKINKDGSESKNHGKLWVGQHDKETPPPWTREYINAAMVVVSGIEVEQ